VLLLLLGAVHQDRRADQRVAEEVGAHRRLCLGELLGEHDALHGAEALPPYSSGQVAQIQPPSKSFWVHSSFQACFSSGVILKPSSNHPSGRFSSSQARISVRELFGVGGVRQVHADNLDRLVN
jgi:hypothetical protein